MTINKATVNQKVLIQCWSTVPSDCLLLFFCCCWSRIDINNNKKARNHFLPKQADPAVQWWQPMTAPWCFCLRAALLPLSFNVAKLLSCPRLQQPGQLFSATSQLCFWPCCKVRGWLYLERCLKLGWSILVYHRNPCTVRRCNLYFTLVYRQSCFNVLEGFLVWESWKICLSFIMSYICGLIQHWFTIHNSRFTVCVCVCVCVFCVFCVWVSLLISTWSVCLSCLCSSFSIYTLQNRTL